MSSSVIEALTKARRRQRSFWQLGHLERRAEASRRWGIGVWQSFVPPRELMELERCIEAARMASGSTQGSDLLPAS